MDQGPSGTTGEGLLGNEGKKRPANDIVLPAHLKEADLVEYIADLCHEWASPANGVVRKLE